MSDKIRPQDLQFLLKSSNAIAGSIKADTLGLFLFSDSLINVVIEYGRTSGKLELEKYVSRYARETKSLVQPKENDIV